MKKLYFGKEKEQLVKSAKKDIEVATPEGWVLMNSPKPLDGAYFANPDGTWLAIKSEEIERSWLNLELSKADIEIYKLNDAGKSYDHWSTYRIALREYPQQKDFPDVERPEL